MKLNGETEGENNWEGAIVFFNTLIYPVGCTLNMFDPQKEPRNNRRLAAFMFPTLGLVPLISIHNLLTRLSAPHLKGIIF